jgi:hypothetical protein
MYQANQPLAQGNTLLMSLSTEELTLVLGAMHIPAFLGFRPPSPMPVAAAQAAERSLRLRQLATVSAEGKYVVDVNLARLLSVCAVPSHMLVVQQDFARREGYFEKPYEGHMIPRFHFFCARGSDIVYHNRATPGVHSFATISNAEMVKVTLATILQMPDVESIPDVVEPTYEVDHASLVNAERLGSPEAVYDRMVNDLNAPPSLARGIASRKRHMVGVVRRNDWQEPGYAYTENTLLESDGYFVVPAEEGGLWVYHMEGDNPRMAIFEAVSGVALIDEMVNRLHAQMGMA